MGNQTNRGESTYERIGKDSDKPNEGDKPGTFEGDEAATRATSFDWLFLKRFLSIAKIICLPRMNFPTIILLAILSLGNVFTVSFTGNVIGGFYQCIVDRNRNDFWRVLILAALVVFLSAMFDATIKFVIELLAWQWRKSLCNHIHSIYFVDFMYYKLVSLDHRVDNPDQRITQDVERFTTSFSIVLSSCLTAPVSIVYYTFETWIFIGWFAPCIILAYFTIGYLVNKFIMSPITRLVFEQEKLEGDFRFEHVRVRTNAESIATYHGGPREKLSAEVTFNKLLRNKLSILRWHWSLNASSNVFAYVGGVLNYVVVALPVLFLTKESDIDSSPLYVGKASFACISLIAGFSQFMNVSEEVSNLAGYTSRIAHMLETLQDLDRRKHFYGNRSEISLLSKGVLESSHCSIFSVNTTSTSPENFYRIETIGDCIQFDDVTCYTPSGTRLAKQLNFTVKKGANLLITGPSGSGKSSIVRVLSGLWPFFEGKITRPESVENIQSEKIFYLPQKPYLFQGTLAEQIQYPMVVSFPNKDSLQRTTPADCLRMSHLNHLLQSYSLYGDSKRWNDILSPGEQQLISFARLFYHRPSFAVLDEATSSLPEDVEKSLYQLCIQRQITLLSIGHRPGLRLFHQLQLYLDVEHEWKLANIE